jgi:aryl-alcohol dehydrogenase-like predicted oxidoreductase
MRHRALGSSGLVVSVVGIGCNAFGSRIGPDAVQDVVDAAFDEGVTFFDTADTYGLGTSEELLGAALAGRRDEVVVATKFGMDMKGRNGPDQGARASRRYVRRAVEASLRRLGTDHIDLYQLHQPDLVTPVEETL